LSHKIDVGFDVQATGYPVAEAVREALAFTGHDKLLVESGAEISFKAILHDPPARPARDPDFYLADGISVYVGRGAIDYFADACFARVNTDTATITVSVPVRGHPRADMLVYALVPVMARFGYYALHAGAVSDGRRGYLFMADSGGGKSTLTLLATRAGWNFISDDFVYLCRRNESNIVLGVQGAIRLRADARAHFPDLIASEPEPAGSHKYRIPVAEAFPGRFRSWCEPDVIVIPDVTGESTTRIEYVSRAEVLAEAMRQSGPFLVDQRTVPEQLSRLRDLIQHCSCFRLKAGTDILSRPEILTTLLACAGREAVSELP